MTIEQAVTRLKAIRARRDYCEYLTEELVEFAIRSFEAWQKVKEELKEEMTGLDMFVEKEHTIRWCLHVIDNALGEVEQ